MADPNQSRSIRIDGGVSGQVVVGDNNTTTMTTGTVAPAPPRPITPTARGRGRRVFVSYVRQDLPVVDRLVAGLRAAGHEPWLDRDRLLPGMHWRDEIRTAINTCDHFLACFSPNYWQPQTYMNEELRTAIARLRLMSAPGTWFIPAILQRCELPDRMIWPGEYLTDTLHFADFATDWDAALRRVLAAIATDTRSRIDHSGVT